MRNYFRYFRETIFLLILVLPAVFFSCSEEAAITSFEQKNPATTPEFGDHLSKTRIDRAMVFDRELLNEAEYPQMAFCTVTYWDKKNIYPGSTCQLPNGSSFEFFKGALTPPPDHPFGEPVTITMMAEKDPATDEIIFTFGPAGCTFETPAEVWFNWTDLAAPNATLYYLNEDGTRQEQLPDQIDAFNKHMCIYIDHFSRYAVAYSN